MASITTTLYQMAEVMEDDELTGEEKLDIISEALIDRAQEKQAKTKRLYVEQGAEPIDSTQAIIDVVRHAMEALQPEPRRPAQDKQLVFDELATILNFFGVVD